MLTQISNKMTSKVIEGILRSFLHLWTDFAQNCSVNTIKKTGLKKSTMILKVTSILWRSFVIFTTLAYVPMDNLCPVFFIILNKKPLNIIHFAVINILCFKKKIRKTWSWRRENKVYLYYISCIFLIDYWNNLYYQNTSYIFIRADSF